MLRSLSRKSIRSIITNTFRRYHLREEERNDVSVFSRSYSDSQQGTKSVLVTTRCLQSEIVSALKVGDRDRAFNFLSTLSRSSNNNQLLRPDDFIHILNYCATSPDTSFFMETWRIMEEKEIEMDKRCHRCIIQALTKGGYLEEALNWLSFLGSSPHSAPDLSMYNIFLNGCAQMGNVVHANSCLDLMQNRLVGKSESTYLALVKLAVLQENLSAVQEIWKQYTKYYCPNIRSLQEFIRSFARLGDLVTALKALQHAVDLVFQGNASIERSVKGSFRSSRLDIPIPSTIDFAFKGSSMEENELSLHPSPVLGAMTRAVEGTGCRSSALLTVANKEEKLRVLSRELAHGSSDILNNGIEVMHVMKILRLSFNDVIQACAQARNCKLAEQLFLQMRKLSLEPDSYTFNGLIRAVVYKRGVREGLKLLKAMEEMNLKPCNATLEMLSISCSKVLEPDLAEALLDQAVESPCIQPFNCLLAACDVMDQPERAVRLLSKMKQLKLKSDMKTYELLFSLFGNVNAPYKKGDIYSQADVAKRISAIEMDMLKNGLQHSHASMVNLLKALGAEGMIKELIHYLSVAKTQFFLANTMEGTIIYNSVLYSLFEADESHMAFQVFKYMKLHDIPPDGLTYNIMIDCCGAMGSSKLASMFLSMMLRDGFFPQKHTYKSLIKIMLGKDNYKKVYWLLYQMSSEGIQPDVVVFNAILRKALMEDRLRIAELIVERMHKVKVQPDPETCYLLYHAYVRSRKHTTAMEALQVLSMRMISEEESVLQKNRKYFEDNFVLAEDSEAELRIIKIFKDFIRTKHHKKEIFQDCGDYLGTALLYLRWCALAGMTISWSPDKGKWAMSKKKQLETLAAYKKKEMKSTKECKGKRRNRMRTQQHILIGALGKTLKKTNE